MTENEIKNKIQTFSLTNVPTDQSNVLLNLVLNSITVILHILTVVTAIVSIYLYVQIKKIAKPEEKFTDSRVKKQLLRIIKNQETTETAN